MMVNSFYNCFHFHLNPMIPCVDWTILFIPGICIHRDALRGSFEKKAPEFEREKITNDKRLWADRSRSGSHRTTDGCNENVRQRLVRGNVFKTTDRRRLCFLDFASASLKQERERRSEDISELTSHQKAGGWWKRRMLLLSCCEGKKTKKGGWEWEEGSLRQQWRQWRDVGYRLRCGFYRLVMYAIPFHYGCFLPSVPIHIIKRHRLFTLENHWKKSRWKGIAKMF